jgi:hypothetical protein
MKSGRASPLEIWIGSLLRRHRQRRSEPYPRGWGTSFQQLEPLSLVFEPAQPIGDIHDRYLSRRDADLLKPPGGGGLLVPTVVSFRRAVANPGSKGQSDQTSICRIGRRRRRGRFSLGYACRPRNRHSGRIGNQVSQRSPRSARTGKPLDSATKLFVFLFQGNLRGPPQAACDSSTNGWPLRSTANK